jgi:hypothetical protein
MLRGRGVIVLPQPHVPASICRGGWEPPLLLPS